MTLTNIGDDRYTIPYGCLFSQVLSDTGATVRSYVCTAELQILDPGDSVSQSWDLTDDVGDPVPLGTYTFPITVLTSDDRRIGLEPEVIVALTPGQGDPCPVEFYGDVGPGASGIAPEYFPLGTPRIGNDAFTLHVQFGLGGAPASCSSARRRRSSRPHSGRSRSTRPIRSWRRR